MFFLTILFLPVIIHARGLHENLWGQGGWIVAVPGSWESWEEGTRRGWEEKASGGVGAGEETKTEGIIKWGDNCMRKQWELWRRKQHKNTIAGHPTAGSGIWALSLPSKGISALSSCYWVFPERERKLFFHLHKGKLQQCEEESLHKLHMWASRGGASGKGPACRCKRHKRHRFDPWVAKIPWRRVWQPTPVFLPRESHGQRSLEGYTIHGVTKSQTQLQRLSTGACKLHMHESETCPQRSLFCRSPWGRSRKDLWGLSPP